MLVVIRITTKRNTIPKFVIIKEDITPIIVIIASSPFAEGVKYFDI